ncbi:MAG: cation-translocating P-type ATPase [Planctomycetaceae bacterium]|nr:cation-translocating P-type ATPase [Planctomycetaceae bacterium]
MASAVDHHVDLGLSSSQVEAQRKAHGTNVITPPERDPWWKLFLEKFDDPVIRILLIAAVIAIAAGMLNGEFIEGIGIIIAVLLATGLAFINEFKANQEFDILNQVNDDVPIKVIRDGAYASVPRKDIVVGDVVLVEAGEETPADGTLIEAVSMLVNESGLTGESEPNKKVDKNHPDKESIKHTTYGADQVLRGSMVIDGHGLFEVTAVGDGTEIGKTARAAAEDTGDETPLNQQLDKLSKVIGVVGLAIAVATFAALVARGALVGEITSTSTQWLAAAIAGVAVSVALIMVWLPMVYDGLELAFGMESPAWLGGGDDDDEENAGGGLKTWLTVIGIGAAIAAVGLGGLIATGTPAGELFDEAAMNRFLEYFMIAVTIIVVAVPEGLAMSVTLSLAYSMRKMTAANTLVRKMHACETIGAATVICSDKTGTLTMNEMKVFETVVPSVEGSLNPNDPNSALLIESISANTTAHLGRDASGTKALGNPTEAALLLWLESENVDYITYRSAFPISYQLTFSTERKWMGTLGKSPRDGKPILHAKGAPEVILSRCDNIRTANGIEPIGPHKEKIEQGLADFQARGMRTLGFAYHDALSEDAGDKVADVTSGLTWLGFAAIADPVRPEVPPAVEACHRAGIQIKMVTGDNAATAREIARQIHLWHDGDSANQHVSGPDFKELEGKDAEDASERLKILSRAKPLDKVKLVRSLQARGEVVAVTGDGINDCGALNYADVGLAMGKTGKAAAKEASDIILLNDSFSTIIDAVMWGRSLYENIQRFILFQLTINVAALCIALLGPFIGVELPLTVIQMLWVNLIMDTFAALALATEPPHRDVLNRPPRKPDAFIVTREMAINIFGVGGVFVVILLGLLMSLHGAGTASYMNPVAAVAAEGTTESAVTGYELSYFFTAFVMLQFWNMFNARCLGIKQSALNGFWNNQGFLFIAAAIFVGQIFIVQFGGELFRTVPLSLTDWVIITVATSLVLWIGEVWRLMTNNSASEPQAA